MAQFVKDRGFDLVVLDTIATLLPIAEENDAGKMMNALLPLHAVTDAGAAVLLVHHPRKGDAGEGQASRGSGALPGFVDIILELRRYDAKNRSDRRRTLTGYSRLDETPDEAVIELTEEGYRMVGSKADASQADRLEVIDDILPVQQPGMAAKDVHGAWPESAAVSRPGKRTIEIDLKHGAETRRWFMSGSGKKGDARRFWRSDSIRASTDSIGARIESVTAVNASQDGIGADKGLSRPA